MKSKIMLLVILAGGIFSSLVLAQDSVYELKAQHSKRLTTTSDVQWLSGLNKIDVTGYKSLAQYIRFHLGAKYEFSNMASFLADYPFGVIHTRTDFRAMALNNSSLNNTELISDRLKLGLEGKLFKETPAGDISWKGQAMLPTMLGRIAYSNRFYNHTALSLNISNVYYLYHLLEEPAFALGSLSYIAKLPVTYAREERDYGDEAAFALGGGYHVNAKATAALQFQGSYARPYTTKMLGVTRRASSSAFAFYTAPSLSWTLKNNLSPLSIRGISRIRLYKSKVSAFDEDDFWGNFDDQSPFSLQLGVRLGIL